MKDFIDIDKIRTLARIYAWNHVHHGCNINDLEDMVQEGTIGGVKAYNNCNKEDNCTGHLCSYVRTRVKYSIIDCIRKLNRTRIMDAPILFVPMEDYHGYIDSDLEKRCETRIDLSRCINKLPPRVKNIVRERLLYETSAVELGDRLKIDPTRVSRLYIKSIGWLQDCLDGRASQYDRWAERNHASKI